MSSCSLTRAWALGAVITVSGCAGAIPGRDAVPLGVTPQVSSSEKSMHRRSTGAGDVFKYAGTLTQTTANGTTRYTVSQTVAVTATPYPYAYAPGSLDFHGIEADSAPGASATWRIDTWRGLGATRGGFAPYLLYGARATDEYGNAYLYRYPTPVVVDRQPESNGAAWSNGGALVYNENDADGTSAKAVYTPDGSYSESVAYPYSCYGATCVLDVAVFSSGRATYTGSALNANGIASLVFGAPSSGTIAIAITFTDGSQQNLQIPAWFAAAAPLYGESDTIHTKVAFPASCAVPPAFGSTGNVVVRHIARVDPAAGIAETQQTQTYTVPVYGTVCVALSDVELVHYDFTDGSFSGTPIARDVTSEVLSLKSAKIVANRNGDREEAFAAAGARFWALAGAKRTKRLESLRRFYDLRVGARS